MIEVKSLMIVAAIIGVIFGIIFNYLSDPITNYYPLLVAFSIIGASVALLVLLVIYKILQKLKFQ